jgi:hypothetical protein
MSKVISIGAMGAPDRQYWADQWVVDAFKAALARKERVERKRCRDIILAYQRAAPAFVREYLQQLIVQMDA